MYDNDKQAKGMRRFGMILFFVSILWGIIAITVNVLGKYDYNRNYASLWSLADKASTIPQKATYIDQFTKKLENSPMRGDYDAVFLKTPDNSFDKNLEALQSLQLRLKEIQTMDVTSFQYNTAIQQITAQEQGEAGRMLGVFSGVWWKTNHFFLWDWVGTIHVLVILILFFFGIRYWGYGKWEDFL